MANCELSFERRWSGVASRLAEDIPAEGEATEVVPGVLWIRMPLPFNLDHVNLWALRDTDGWTLVDTGVNTTRTQQAWRQLISGAFGGAPIKRVIVTHLHEDHVGLAGWMTETFGCTLSMSRLEYLTCRLSAYERRRGLSPDHRSFFTDAGWSEDSLQRYERKLASLSQLVYPLPDSLDPLADGDTIRIGRFEWRIVTGHGHSPEHLCLYDAERGLFISGDHVLPGITTNVSVTASEPRHDTLSAWLDSLAHIKAEVPEDVLVLPSHKLPFTGLHKRLDQLCTHHRQKLEHLSTFLEERPRCLSDIFTVLFRRPVPPEQMAMATGESMAYLNHLRTRTPLIVERDSSGTCWYHVKRSSRD